MTEKECNKIREAFFEININLTCIMDNLDVLSEGVGECSEKVNSHAIELCVRMMQIVIDQIEDVLNNLEVDE